MTAQVNERSRLPVTIQFADGNWVVTAPNSARYRIDCETTGQVIQDWVVLATGARVVATVTASQNSIIDDNNRFEVKVMAVEANYGLETQYTDSFKWKVKNLQGFT